MMRNHSNTADRVEKVDGGEAQDVGRVFGFGVLGALILVLLVAFSIGTAYAQGAGKALNFDGADDWVTVGTGMALSSSFTLEAWIKPAATPGKSEVIVRGHGDTGYLYNYHLAFNASGDLKVEFYSTAAHWAYAVENSKTFSGGTWYHIAGVFDDAGDDLRLYINGVDYSEYTAYENETPKSDLADPTWIGAVGFTWQSTEYGADEFNGIIDEVRIWNVARTQAQIQDNMCKKLVGTETGLVGYWRLDDNCDDSAGSNNGSNNGATFVASGAAIGDASAYTTSSSNFELTVSGGNEKVSISDIKNSPDIVQLYRVDEAPNVTSPPTGIEKLDPLRYWGVFVSGGTSPTYDFAYDFTDHPGISTPENLRLCTRANGAETTWTMNSTAPVGNVITLNDQSGTEYILGTTTPDNTLPVELISFTATGGEGMVTLEWTTQSEWDNRGFHIYRREDTGRSFQRITQELIAGAGNSSGPRGYSWEDRRVENGQTYWYQLESVDFQGQTQTYGPVSATSTETLPQTYRLNQNYPNPFNPQTWISYQLPEFSPVTIKIYNVRGQLVTTLVDGEQAPGTYRVRWSGRDLGGAPVASGVYFCQMTSGTFTETTKMILLR